MKKIYIIRRAKTALLFQIVFMFVELAALFLSRSHSVIFLTAAAMGVLELIIFSIWTYQNIIKPVDILNKVYRAYSSGYIAEDVFAQPYEWSKEYEAMMQKMHSLLEQKELVELYHSQAEYLALQNQMNPHFLYNTLEGIRSEALVGGLPNVGEMAEVLAKFFRYTISNVRNMVTVQDEINNVKHYYQIQKFRFGDKIALETIFEDNEEEIRKCYMPKLILQPMVENAIRHGLEPLVGSGKVTIRFQVVSRRLIVVVSDNGVGMKETDLQELNLRLEKIHVDEEDRMDQTGGIAMSNVNSRIKLLFGEGYGIRFYSKENLGTDVELVLPFEMMDLEGAKERS